MKKLMWTCALILAVTAPAWAAEEELNQPLECMKPYKFKAFGIAAFCFHNYPGTDYTLDYAKNLEAANFNIAIETGYMLPFYEKTKVKQIVSLMVSDTLKERDVHGTKRTHPIEQGSSVADAAKKYAASETVVGYQVGAKYGKAMPSRLAAEAKAVDDLKSGHFPWIAHCSDLTGQAKAGVAILSLETFGRMKHDGFGYDNKGWPHDKRNDYCDWMEAGRRMANEANMAFWPMLPAATISKGQGESQGSLHGASEIRFMVLAPIAYGAQGVVYFGYSTAREIWQTNGSSYAAARDVNKLVADVIGPRVLGHRSIGVFHSQPDAPGNTKAKIIKSALIAGEGKLIEKMDEALMAGVLVKEADFKSGANTPHYVMLIDARTAILKGEDALKPREVSLTFGPSVQSAELVPAAGEEARKFQREVKLTLRPADGRLIKLTMK
ncbi:MAG: hypothetical protein ABFD92_08410 [Planctomycetaceae bacterium]|nr:hypothetical protein [Planctomycetaceae bacterium]